MSHSFSDRIGSALPVRKRSHAQGGSAPLTLSAGKSYIGGVPDHVVVHEAGVDGQAGAHDPEKFGVNSESPHLVEEINASHDTTADLVGHETRGSLQPVVSRLQVLRPAIAAQVETVLDRVDDYADKGVTKAKLEREAKAQHVGLPHRLAHVWLSVCIVLLVYGDLPVIAKSFEQFHLSDHPLIPGVHLTDELHLAGLASVAALIILSHIAGYKLRLLAHAFNLRRLAPKEERSKLPRPSGFAAMVTVVCIAVALILLFGLSSLRVDYLASQGQSSNGGAFFAVNIGILAAAVGAGFMFSSPFGRQLVDAGRLADEALQQVEAETEQLVVLVGEHNAGVDQIGTLFAQGGQHIGASEHDAQRQGHLVARQTILTETDPTTERLFADPLPQPKHYDDAELLATLVGIGEFSTPEKLDISRVTERRTAVRELINDVRLGKDVTGEPAGEEVEVDADEVDDEDGDDTGETAAILTINPNQPSSGNVAQAVQP